MAEAILFDIVVKILEELGSLTFKKIAFSGVETELKKLRDTVSRVKAVLLDAEERKDNNREVTIWLRKLQDAIYDADDLLDDFSTDALRRKVMTGNAMTKEVRIFFSKSNQIVDSVKMASKTKAIRARLDAISGERFKFKFTERTETRYREQTHSFVRAEEVIGREDDKNEIVKLLLESNVQENVAVFPIIGMGGLGKTTLAQLVFNDEQIRAHFGLKMWASVSENFDVRKIAEKILESATKVKPERYEMDTLQHHLRNEIEGKKYLLVMDDVWNEDPEKWIALKNLLMGGARGSRILLTSRSEKVAMSTLAAHSYPLRGLDKENSWSLFKQMAFEPGKNPNSGLVSIGKEIVEKCGGVPLAIRTIGRVLYFKKTELEWLSVKNDELANITQQEKGILPVLKLSFDHLPSQLKHCFAYCSLFPKNYKLDKRNLINLWMAQGFIQSSHVDQNLEDVGHQYFMDLLWRSFFQEAEEGELGNVLSCTMHNLMHDLAQSVAGNECAMANPDAENIVERTRHVSFPFCLDALWKIPNSLLLAKKIRTFLVSFHTWTAGSLDESTCKTLVTSFTHLRVFDLHNAKIEMVPKSICHLTHLRYLDLSSNSGIHSLPSSITKLHNLQTLKLSHCERLMELPKDIKKLVSLRHLEIDGCKRLMHMPCGLGELTSLRTLSQFVVAKDGAFISKIIGGIGELNGLNNLRGELVIVNLDHIRDSIPGSNSTSLKGKQYLQSLRLIWNQDQDQDQGDIVDYGMSMEGLQPHPNLSKLHVQGYWDVKFPNWFSSVTNLVSVTIKDCHRCKNLPALDQLPSLKFLFLFRLTALEYISEIGSRDFSSFSHSSASTQFFPSLKELKFWGCCNLKEWWRRRDMVNADNAIETTTTMVMMTSMADFPSFPCLSKLTIRDCPGLTSMPLYPSLEEELHLDIASLKPLQETMLSSFSTSSLPSFSSSSISPLCKLKSLHIKSIDDLESLPENGLQNLTSLKYLSIHDCSRLTSLSRGMQHLTYLENLHISNCKELDFSDDDDGMQCLKSLRFLVFSQLAKLVSLPKGLQHVTSLQKLEITDCPDLMTLLEWMGNLASLQQLTINRCPNFRSLPEGMCNLTSLQELIIYRCPNLSISNEDRRNIAHIPYVVIDGEESSNPSRVVSGT